ncbi:hypothetical protein SAMN04487989_101437 [Bizionia echini]|uniref:DUF6705 domain-containing protein n=1 Tax=Bizionia echini TaxID=649333 RepID=A0A1I4Z1H9_9FLAO|nr:DUF6705 family protein [Bizionia echini]SFN44027.1 hypothetical protein SAMN04487989_101437 [Bizionia echini]
MKTILITLALLLGINIYSQNPAPIPSVTENICSGLTEEDVPNYTYFSDLNGTFNDFIGTWKWENGNQIVVFELTKVTQKYFPEHKIFEDYMIGNYSYSIDSGNSFIVNSIISPVNENPSENPMYTSCVENGKLIFIFNDIVLNKGYCYATFEFLSGNLNQLNVKIENPKEIPGRFDGEPAYNYNFTLPTEIIVNKQ